MKDMSNKKKRIAFKVLFWCLLYLPVGCIFAIVSINIGGIGSFFEFIYSINYILLGVSLYGVFGSCLFLIFLGIINLIKKIRSR